MNKFIIESGEKNFPRFLFVKIITSHGRCRLAASSSWSVTRRICNVTHQEAARGGPVVLRSVRATPCLNCSCMTGLFNRNKRVKFLLDRNSSPTYLLRSK